MCKQESKSYDWICQTECSTQIYFVVANQLVYLHIKLVEHEWETNWWTTLFKTTRRRKVSKTCLLIIYRIQNGLDMETFAFPKYWHSCGKGTKKFTGYWTRFYKILFIFFLYLKICLFIVKKVTDKVKQDHEQLSVFCILWYFN